jgi:ribosomal protein L40E
MQPRFFPYSPERDVYRLLQVGPSAQPDEIMVAIRRLARTFHPDHNGSPRATEEMQVVNAVRNLLIDPQARSTYDRARYRFLTENAARRRREAPLAARSGVKLPAHRMRTRPIASRIVLTGRALLAAFRAILDAFAPARGRLLTTIAGAVPKRTTKPAAEGPGPMPPPAARPAVSWESDAVISLEPERVGADVAAMQPASVRRPLSWEADAPIVLEPIAMALPPMMPVPIRPRGTVVPYRSDAPAVTESPWEASVRMLAANSEMDLQDCGRCGLSLSISARFCRRCGASQARSA